MHAKTYNFYYKAICSGKLTKLDGPSEEVIHILNNTLLKGYDNNNKSYSIAINIRDMKRDSTT